MRITKVVALFALTILAFFGLIGCTINENITETVDKKDGINKEKASTDNSIIEHHGEDELQSEYNEFLLKANEEIIIGFSIVDSNKVVALCVSKEEPSYIVYRFGTSENVEFEFPEDLVDSWDKFTYSYYLRGGSRENEGLDLNYVTFEYDGAEYVIFQEYSSENASTDVGIRITDLTTFEETILKASKDSIRGDLIELRDNDKIKIEAQ